MKDLEEYEVLGLVILGGTSSGKGTQTEFLANKYKLKKMGMGQISRDEIDKGTPLGKKIEPYVKAGILIPDKEVIPLVKGWFSELDNKRFISDGFPRTMSQALSFEKILKSLDLYLHGAIHIDISQEAALERFKLRIVCKYDGSVYNLKYSPPKKEGICDICGRKLEKRKDVGKFNSIWNWYIEDTIPLIEHYKKSGLVITVDGNPHFNTVWKDLDNKLQEHLRRVY